jgi:hypothetical protein
MLSPKEYERIQDQLKNIPKPCVTQQQQNYQKILQKKLKEHYYASNYAPFESSPHEIIFINRVTTKETLIRLIQIVNDSKIFTLDTESVRILHESNKPALIQLQIITSETFSIILIIEARHLPRIDQHEFQLIKKLFDLLFQSNKTIFIWGTIDELIPFIQYQLFTRNQIYLSNNKNTQLDFQEYWSKKYKHQQQSLTTNTLCKCQTCLGIQPGNIWALQMAVAMQINRWLDKRFTCKPFDIGLDPRLCKLDNKQMEFRQQMCNYAAYDCDAIYQIITSTNIINEINSSQSIALKPTAERKSTLELQLIDELEPVSDDDDEITFSQLTPSIERLQNEQTLNINKQEQLTSISKSGNSNWKITSTNDNQITNQQQVHTTQSQLSPEERKRIHNRSCTIKQRRRYYKNEIIIKNIDKRFTYEEIKDILKYKNIVPYAINAPISSKTNERTLYIGIREETKLSEYEHEIKHLFTSSHYRQFQHMKHRIKYSHRNNDAHVHQHQRQSHSLSSTNRDRPHHLTQSRNHHHHRH